MANATKRVPSTHTPFGDNSLKFPGVTTAQTYYPGAFVGLTVLGYATKCDDAVSLLFKGFMEGGMHRKIESGFTALDPELDLQLLQPRWGVVKIASAAITDVGKLVYAKFDDEVQFATGVFGNLVGRMEKLMTSTAILVQFIYSGSRGVEGAARTPAATGAQSLTKFDLGKTIMLANTAAYALTLPPVADTQPGDTLQFVKTTSDAHAVTLTGNASENIDGSNTLATIDAQYDCAKLISTGAAWVVANRDIT